MAKSKRLQKVMKRRYSVQTSLGNFLVYDNLVCRVIALCTRRSDALLINKALNKT